MLGNPKNIFWEALLLTGVVFAFGLLIGFAFEESRYNQINEYYAESEISLMDVFALNSFIISENSSCAILISSNLEFADKIYEEARLLENYENAGKLDDNLKIAHKKYDLLRTILWMNTIKIREKCDNNFSSVVYLYEQEGNDLAKKATQNVWSKILFDLKQKKGNEIVLIPIAVDSNLTSLNPLLQEYGISSFPSVVINNKIITELNTVEELEEFLK